MSFANPTPLHVDSGGTLNGRSYRVAGRVVMGMDDDGEIYYWNEFNLMGDDGESATLVYEETERGGEWRLFTIFDPEFPLTVEEAAAKSIGDQLNLDGKDVRVTLVDESRVYHIEGEAPEGEEVGDVAHYFNAETTNRMIVVSWTGDEVEYYRGVTISAGVIASAFNLSRERLASLSPAAARSSLFSSAMADGEEASSSGVLKVILVALVAVIGLVFFATHRPMRSRSIITKASTPAAPLKLDSAGKLDGKTWRIRGHAVVEIAQVGRLYDRHEYQLLDEEGNRALLVCGLKPGGKDWCVFKALQPMKPLTAKQAAALRLGEDMDLDDQFATVSEHFQSVIRQTEGSDLPDLKNGTPYFGFIAKSGYTLLLVRWNEGGINFYRGSTLAAKDVTAAFSHKSDK